MSDKNNLQVEVNAHVTEQVHIDVSQPESQIDNLKGAVIDFLKQILPEFDTVGSKLLEFIANIIIAKNSITNVSDEAIHFFKKYENNGKDLTKSVSNSLSQKGGFDSFVDSSKLADKSLISFLKNADYGTKNLANYQKYLNAAGKMTSIFSQLTATAGNSLESFGATLLATAISSLIDMGINAAIEGLDYLIHYEEIQEKAFEDAKKGTAETANSITSLKSEISDTSSKAASLSSEFANLVQGVNPFTNENINLSTESYQQFLDVNNQLAELFPSLCHRYDENGNAILGLSGDVDSVTASIQRLVAQQNHLAKSDMRKHLEEYVNGTDDNEGIFTALKGYKKEATEAENEVNSLEFLYNGLINKKGKKDFGTNYNEWMNYLDNAKYDLGQNAYNALYNATVYNTDGPQTYSIDFSKIKLDEKKKKSITSSYNTLKQDLDFKASLKKTDLDAKNREMSSMMMTWLEDTDFYKNGENEDPFTKRTIEQMVGSIKWSDLNLENLDDSKKFIQDSVLIPLSHIKNDPKTKLNVKNAINDLFTTDFSKMSFEDADEKVTSFLKIIKNGINKYMPEEQQKSLDDMYEMYGFETYRDTKDKLQKRLEQIAPKGTKDYQRIREYTDKLNRKQIEEFLDVTYDSTIPEDAIHKYEEHIKSNKKNKRKPFQKMWDTLDTTGNSNADKKTAEEKEKLLQLAEKGKLTVNEFKKSSIAGTILDGTKLSEEEATQEINNLVEDIKQLEAMRTGIRAITSVYNEKKNSEQNVVSPTTLNSLENTIEVDSWEDKDKKVWENYKSVAGDDSRSLTDLKKAQDELASSYVNSNNFLSNLKETNKEYYEGLLKEMGVINAHEIVTEHLEEKQKNLSTVKKELGIKTSDFKNATVSEIAALYDVKSASKKASTAMYNLLSSKIKSGQVTIKTAADCQNLINMANAAGIATHKIKNLQNAEIEFSLAERQEKEADGLQAKINATPDGGEIEYVKQTGQIVKFSSKTAAAARVADYRNLSTKNKKKAEKNVAKYLKKGYKKIKLSDVNPKDDGKGGGKNKSDNSKQQFDWIERRVNQLTSSINLLNAKKENLFSVKKKNSNLNKQIKETTKLINTYSSAIKKYSKKADNVKISKDKTKNKNIKKLIRNGKIQIKDYDEGTAKKIQAYQNWYDKSESAEQSRADTEKQKRELEKEKYQNYADLYNSRVSRAEAKEAKEIGYKKKNDSVDTQIKNVKKSYDYQIKIAKKLEKNKAEWQKLEYEREKKIAELRLQQINNIQQDYENRIGLTENERENIENAISLAEARGKIVTAGYYKEQNNLTYEKRAKAVEEKNQIQISLDKALKNKEIKEGSDEWYEVQSKLHTLDNTINECDVTIANNTRAIREVHKTMLDEMAENKNSINMEADFIAGLMSRKEMTDSDTGTLTKEGIGTLGAYGIKMETSQAHIRELNEERAILEDMKKKGILDFGDGGKHKYDSLEDFEKDYNELIQKQQEWVKTEYDAEQGIIDQMKEYYQAQIDYMKEIIDAKKKALDLEKDLYDYQKNIAEKTKNIALLEKQAAAIKGDTSEEGRARLAKIQLSLDEANQDLQDTEYDRYISDQQNMLDNMYSEYEDLMQRLFKDTDALLRDGITAINENGAVIKGIMDKTAEDYNYDYSANFNAIMTAFNANQPIVTGIKESLTGDESSIAGILAKQNETIKKIYENASTSVNGSGSGNKSANGGNDNGNKNGDRNFSINKDEIYSNTITDQYGHKINSDGIGEFGKTLQKISPYLNAVKGSPKSALNKLLKKKTGAYISDKNKNADLKKISKALGVKYDGKYTKSGTVYKYLKAHGFQKGGIVRANNVPPTGDYVPVRVNPNETILTQKFTDMLPQAVNVMDNLQKAIRVPDYTRQIAKTDAGTSYGDIHFDIDLPNVTNSSTAKDIIHALQNDTKVQQVFSEGVNNLMTQKRITGRTRGIR